MARAGKCKDRVAHSMVLGLVNLLCSWQAVPSAVRLTLLTTWRGGHYGVNADRICS